MFAAQFSLSHLAWLVTYPIAGWLGTSAGFDLTWSILLVLAVAGTVAATALWPADAESTTGLPAQSAAQPATEPEPDLVLAGANAGNRAGSPTAASFGDPLHSDEARSAAGTLAACQCSCVRPL